MKTIVKQNQLSSALNTGIVPAVNFHLWEPCNMRCKFCFATFQDVKANILPKGHLPKDQSLAVVRELAFAGFEKITFVGGEPTLCPWLPELMQEAKTFGMNTGIVTNATRITEENLAIWRPYLDWIGISIDSTNEETNLKMGRAIAGTRALNKAYYYAIIDLINKYDYKLKINTVVTQHNVLEDLTDLISYSGTGRWKVFQVLPIAGENDKFIDTLKISSIEYQSFLDRHHSLSSVLIPESNEKMKGSYAMVDPAGRFFENSTGKLTYSLPILEVGALNAYAQAHPSQVKFLDRGGLYNY